VEVMLPKPHALAGKGKEEECWRGCDRRQVSGRRRCRRSRKENWLWRRWFAAQCCKVFLKALTLTCGVADWSWLWYSEWSLVSACPQAALLLLLCTLAATSFSPWRCRPTGGRERSARRSNAQTWRSRSGITDLGERVGGIIVPL
jgi:hypothetical protein